MLDAGLPGLFVGCLIFDFPPTQLFIGLVGSKRLRLNNLKTKTKK
jgi:hypothetical protein